MSDQYRLSMEAALDQWKRAISKQGEKIIALQSDLKALREQNRVLREALQEIYEGRWTPGVSCYYEDDARSIYPTREMRIRSIAQAALTATSQPGGEG